jgi:DNA-binding transcriptional MerR regulator
MGLKIGELAKATGTTPPTIRFYEEIGLLPLPRRVGGQRRYGQDDLRRLTFIRRCREFGFPIEQVRVLATLMQDRKRSCSQAREVAHAHLAAVREKLRELRGLERSIADFIEASDNACRGGAVANCVVLNELAEPAELKVASEDWTGHG